MASSHGIAFDRHKRILLVKGIDMALGSGQYSWQDPMRNAGIVAKAEKNRMTSITGSGKDKRVGLLLIGILILLLLLIVVLFNVMGYKHELSKRNMADLTENTDTLETGSLDVGHPADGQDLSSFFYGDNVININSEDATIKLNRSDKSISGKNLIGLVIRNMDTGEIMEYEDPYASVKLAAGQYCVTAVTDEHEFIEITDYSLGTDVAYISD